MNKLTCLPFCLGCVFAVSTSHAIDLKQSKVTQVVNDVQIISATSQQTKAVSVNDVFTMPDILRTGPASRAELVAADETVTRVGANTIFSFDPASRTIDLKQGSLLFHSPHGKGGGTIHTGSATASVLGTTLIVTTTPTGGMKVLDLEGNVEVKFLNGLKQNLDPGHMTFVLPGGNQLAPIIVFRLDDLTKNSLLVGGFHQDLSSMPLIQEQITKQLKLIQNGKLTDTGLEVGSDAGPTTVQVLDPSTLQNDLNGLNNATVNAALRADATINQPSLTDPGIPTPPTRIFLDVTHQFLLPGNTFYLGQGFVGFAANNIYFNTIHLDSLPVALSPFVNYPIFDIVAAGNITFAGSVDFQGLADSDSIVFSLVAGNQIIVTPGITILANIANFEWQTPHTITFDGVSVFNDKGNMSFGTGDGFVARNNAYLRAAANLSVQTPGDISISHTTLGADTMFMTSSGGATTLDSVYATLNSIGTFAGDQGLTVSGSTFFANSGSGVLAFNSAHGSVNITGTSIQSEMLTVNSGDGILLDGNGQSFNIASANFSAKNVGNISHADFSNLGYLNMQANTITVSDTTFNPDNAYNFGTGTGQVNVNNGTMMGHLNLNSDFIGTTAITSASQIDVTTAASTAAGIHSYSLNPVPKVVKTPAVVHNPVTFSVATTH